jgi:tetratricopeptide (TPR) repeat protein
MARYDRLAPLGMPSRARAFPCWSVLRDLEGHERDTDLARRARLRFLALRPVQRLIARGVDQVQLDSLERQIDHVREELGQLPARDLERAVLARFLNEVRTAQAERAILAALKVCEFAEQSGQRAAAEEYARTALELAERSEIPALGAVATRALARVMLAVGHDEEAEILAARAAELALGADRRADWLLALGQWAAVHRAGGAIDRATDVLTQGLRRARDWKEDALIGLALAQLCRHDAACGNQHEALEHGWAALRLLEHPQERCEILRLLGDVLVAIGLTRAADRCFSLAQRAEEPGVRSAALAGVSLSAALAGDRERYRDRRTAALRELTQVPPLLRAGVHSELARASLIAGDLDHARDHVRDTLSLLNGDGAPEVRRRAEEVLSALERHAVLALAAPPASTLPEQTRRIAAELEQTNETLVAAG